MTDRQPGLRVAACFLNSSFSLGSLVRTKKKIRPDWLLLILSVSLSHSHDTIPPTSGRTEVSFSPFSQQEGTSWENQGRVTPSWLFWDGERPPSLSPFTKKTIVKQVLLHRSCQKSLDREAERTDNTTESSYSVCFLRYIDVTLRFSRYFTEYSPAILLPPLLTAALLSQSSK